MRNQRTFSLEFKRQVVEEILSGESRPAQLCRRHNILSSLLYHWKRQYSRGKFNNEPIEEGALKDRVEKLERLVGRLTLENEFLKKGLQHSPAQSQRNGKSSPGSSISSGEISLAMFAIPVANEYYQTRLYLAVGVEGTRIRSNYQER